MAENDITPQSPVTRADIHEYRRIARFEKTLYRATFALALLAGAIFADTVVRVVELLTVHVH
jgi:hypothetical protein